MNREFQRTLDRIGPKAKAISEARTNAERSGTPYRVVEFQSRYYAIPADDEVIGQSVTVIYP